MQTQQPQTNNQIANPESGQLPQVKGPEMNDRDYLEDGLSKCFKTVGTSWSPQNKQNFNRHSKNLAVITHNFHIE